MRLLSKKDIANKLGTSINVAMNTLQEHKVYPIDFGIGRGRGFKWLESSVEEIIYKLHCKAQEKTIRENYNNSASRRRQSKSIDKERSLSSLNIDEIMTLVAKAD